MEKQNKGFSKIFVIKSLFGCVMVLIFAYIFTFAGTASAISKTNFGSYLVRVADRPEVYSVTPDDYRHHFGNSTIFWSYYTGTWDNLKLNGVTVSIKSITPDEFNTYKIGANVTVKPGSRLIRFQSSNRLYLVFTDVFSKTNNLKGVSNEECLRYYGSTANCWKISKIIPDTLAANYNFDESLTDDIVFEDPDNDGLSIWDEFDIYGSDPYKWDTDGDGYSDGWEVLNGYSPISVASTNALTNAKIMTAVINALQQLELKRADGIKINREQVIATFSELNGDAFSKISRGYSFDSNFYNVSFYAKLIDDSNTQGKYYCADSNGFSGIVTSTPASGICTDYYKF